VAYFLGTYFKCLRIFWADLSTMYLGTNINFVLTGRVTLEVSSYLGTGQNYICQLHMY
jgi:hypothetical protein